VQHMLCWVRATYEANRDKSNHTSSAQSFLLPEIDTARWNDIRIRALLHSRDMPKEGILQYREPVSCQSMPKTPNLKSPMVFGSGRGIDAYSSIQGSCFPFIHATCRTTPGTIDRKARTPCYYANSSVFLSPVLWGRAPPITIAGAIFLRFWGGDRLPLGEQLLALLSLMFRFEMLQLVVGFAQFGL
jgi:hypothetical protein